jgi:hypothetical protein
VKKHPLSENTYFWILIIITVHTTSVLLIYSQLFQRISLCCGDSAFYLFLAHNLNIATADRPSGFPFFLRALFLLSDDPNLLVFVNIFFGFLIHIFCFLTLKNIFLQRNTVPFFLSLLFFMNPAIIIMESMVFMSDTLAFFIVALIFYLIFLETRTMGSIFRDTAICTLLGYLTIVRSIFLYLAPFIILFMILKRLDMGKERLSKIVVQGFVFLVIFSVIPASYAIFFNGPRVGKISVENFGGRSAFAVMLPYLSCDKLLAISETDEEKTAIMQYCDDTEILFFSSDELRWIESSTMNRMERALVDNDRVRGNELFRRWFFRSLLRYPEAAFRVIRDNVLKEHILRPVSNQMSVINEPNLVDGCETLVREVFRLEPIDYLKLWKENKRDKSFALSLIFRLELWITRLANTIALLVFVCIPFLIVWRRICNMKLLFLYSIGLIYFIIVALVGTYDTRFYIISNYFVLLTIGAMISSARLNFRIKHRNTAGERC